MSHETVKSRLWFVIQWVMDSNLNLRRSLMKRRPTAELRNIIRNERVFASPPPAPVGTSLREWFAGLALGNPEVMRDVERSCQADEALRIADELLGALVAPRQPTKVMPLTKEEMQRWDAAFAESNETKERQSRATIPQLNLVRREDQSKTLIDDAVPVHPGSIPPPKPLTRLPEAGRYLVVNPPGERLKGQKP